MAQITYDDKVALNVNSDIADINKVNASDMNEIKASVNNNDDMLNGNAVAGNMVVESIRTKNMFDKDSVVKGSYISDTGSINTNANAFYGNYIPVEPSTNYIYSGRTNGWQTEALYDSSKNFISRVTGDSFTTTANTYYVRTIGAITDLNNIQLEKGSTATAYTPYQNLDGMNKEVIQTTATINSSYIGTVDVNKVTKIGNVVQLVFRGYTSNSIPNNTPFINVPYSPAISSDNFFIAAIGTRYAYTDLLWGYITGNKTLSTNAVSSGKWIHINTTYITSE